MFAQGEILCFCRAPNRPLWVEAVPSNARRLSFRLALRNSQAVIRRLACLAIVLALAACSRLVETDQARLCRMALPPSPGPMRPSTS